ncbi:hypothetical protein CBM2614_U10026 [Cupriavidus taiwanensis]|nr:hypothetical protein CBM2614_U10026 [Cupriavidus taiwanensis]
MQRVPRLACAELALGLCSKPRCLEADLMMELAVWVASRHREEDGKVRPWSMLWNLSQLEF